MTIEFPELPAVPDFPTAQPGGAYNDDVVKAREIWEKELVADGWEDMGEKDGVKLSRKPNPEEPNGVPIVRGTCTVPNATTDEIFATIGLPGMRKLWDPRFDLGAVLTRFSLTSMEFYTVMKGASFFISPRDFVGAQWVDRSATLNEAISVTQVSVEDDAHAPPQSGKVRGKIRFSGWNIKPAGPDVDLTYLVNISLEGSIPISIVKSVATEIPTCAGRVRDVFQSHGPAPYIHGWSFSGPGALILQKEAFDSGTETWSATFTTSTDAVDGRFNVSYDKKRLYKNGVQVDVTYPDGHDPFVTVQDDGEGVLDIKVSGVGGKAEINVTRK